MYGTHVFAANSVHVPVVMPIVPVDTRLFIAVSDTLNEGVVSPEHTHKPLRKFSTVSLATQGQTPAANVAAELGQGGEGP